MCTVMDIKDMTKQVTRKFGDVDTQDVISFLEQVKLFRWDLRAMLSMEQHTSDELKIRILYCKVESTAMRKALETMVDRLGDLALYFYDGGFDYLINGVKELMFPHAKRLLEARWRDLKQNYGESAVAFSVRFRSLALGMSWNPEDCKTKFI